MKNRANLLKFSKQAVMASSALVLAGCATTKDNVDPYEKYNRAVFTFNRALDTVVARPIADFYDTLTPAPIQGGIGRMYTNFYEPSRVINDILQGEMRYAYQDGARFLVNSTVGLAGYFDVARHWGLPLHQQDFGITMARWGWEQSAYFVMPLLGVYTLRDLVAVPANSYAFTFWPYIQPESLAWDLYALEKVHTRAELRPADKVIDEAFDPYLFVRDAYLQKRKEDIDIQRRGRTQEVKPSVEGGDDQPQATQAQAQSPVKSSESGKDKTPSASRKAPRSTPIKQTPAKALPDIIGLENQQLLQSVV